jgi:hypothetical protein
VVTVADTLVLGAVPDDRGTLIGVAYVRVASGRPQPFEGILSYDQNLDITVTSETADQFRLQSDTNGIYSIRLAPGIYSVLTRRNVLVENLEVVARGTTIVPLFSGERLNF